MELARKQPQMMLLKLFLSLSLVGGSVRGYSATRVITFWQDAAIIGGNINVPADLTNAVFIADSEYGSYGYDRLAITADQRSIYWGTSVITPYGWSNVVAVSSGRQNLELQSDGSVRAWTHDFIGDASVPHGLSNVVAIAAGRSLCLALKSDGTVVGWGETNVVREPLVPDNLSNVVAIAAGSAHALALKADGTVVAWGLDEGGQATVPSGLMNVVRVAAGDHHSLALKADGTLVAWGTYGSRTGTYSGLTLELPAAVPPDLKNVAAMIGGEYYTLALKTDGTVVEWGAVGPSGSYIPAGKKLTTAETIPVIVPLGLTNVIAISHGLALVGDVPAVLGAERALMSEPNLGPEGFRCSILSESGRVYRLESKNSLADNDWTALPLVAGNGSMIVLTDTTPGGTHRFYRMRRW